MNSITHTCHTLLGLAQRGLPRLFPLLAVLFGCSSPNSSIGITAVGVEGASGVLAITNVNVIPMDGPATLPNQTVIIRNGRIDQVGPSNQLSVPRGAAKVNGSGRYLIPGLMDMHVHHFGTAGDREVGRNLFLAHGVTTVRHMWGYDGIIAERDAIREGQLTGPRIFAASPGMDGPGGRWESVTPAISTPAEARSAVETAAAQGYDFVKVYSRLDTSSFNAAIETAGRHNLPVVGHVPNAVGYEKALASGMVTVEHLIAFRREASLSSTTDNLVDTQRAEEVARQYAASEIWVVPTVYVLTYTPSDVVQIQQLDVWRYVTASQRSFWSQFPAAERHTSALANHLTVLQILRNAGVRILVGTDTGVENMIGGYSMWEELDHLVMGGFSPYEVLHAATAQPAVFLGMESELGRVKIGYNADLVLLEENPLDDIAAIRTIVGVVTHGRWLSRSHLIELLESSGS